MIQIWSCNPEASLYAQLAADSEREWLEWRREQDEEEDEILVSEFVEAFDHSMSVNKGRG